MPRAAGAAPRRPGPEILTGAPGADDALACAVRACCAEAPAGGGVLIVCGAAFEIGGGAEPAAKPEEVLSFPRDAPGLVFTMSQALLAFDDSDSVRAALVQPTAGVQGAKRDSARRASTAESEHRPPPSGRWLVLGIPSERVFAEACLAAALPALPEILAQLAS